MTQIIFDHKRTDGYGRQVYLPGQMIWSPSNRAVSPNPPMGIMIGLGGPVSIEVQPTDDTFYWEVTEQVQTTGGTPLVYKRCVMVPASEDSINYIDLPDVDFSVPYPGQNSPATVEEVPVVEEAPAATE